jgi:outer membrane protein assembly factor BamA
VVRDPCFARYTWQQEPGITYVSSDGTCNDLDFGKFNIDGDSSRYDQWASIYGKTDGLVQLSASLGYDTLARSYQTGPLSGNSVLLSGEWNILPFRGSSYGEIQLDAQKYFRIWRTANLHFRAAAGTAFGNQFSRQFFVWPIYNLRGIPFSGTHADKFTGKYYTVGTAELQIPLDRLVRLAIFQNIEGIAAVDVGSVYSEFNPATSGGFDDALDNRTAAGVLGFNFNLAIFQFRLHFAKPFDIGGLEPGTDLPDGWVTNFSIEYLFF